MCTLIVLHRCVPDRPLVVAANRDEFLDRPAEEPALRSSRTGPIVAPLDLEAGGTWVGVSARGVFAGLTNLRPDRTEMSMMSIERASTETDRGARSDLRSRGEVVTMALEADSAADAVDMLSKLEEETYNPFQLLVADGHEAWLVVYRGSSRVVQLEPGPHIVGNVVDERIEAELGSASRRVGEPGQSDAWVAEEEPRARKLTRIRARVEKLMTEPGRDFFEGLAGICREHVHDRGDGRGRGYGRAEGGREEGKREEGREGAREEGRAEQSPFESTCVHVADRYGTRSSLLLELSTDPAANRFWTTDGPPCERPFENRSSLLRDLGVRLSTRAGTELT